MTVDVPFEIHGIACQIKYKCKKYCSNDLVKLKSMAKRN
jgi:hypothetical protein